jgi:hypothetical protein
MNELVNEICLRACICHLHFSTSIIRLKLHVLVNIANEGWIYSQSSLRILFFEQK